MSREPSQPPDEEVSAASSGAKERRDEFLRQRGLADDLDLPPDDVGDTDVEDVEDENVGSGEEDTPPSREPNS